MHDPAAQKRSAAERAAERQARAERRVLAEKLKATPSPAPAAPKLPKRSWSVPVAALDGDK